MKKFLLVLTTILSFNSSYGQTNVYHPFPDSNAVWRESYSFNPCNCPNPCSNSCGTNSQYFINGDTVMGAYSYHKIYVLSSYYFNSNQGLPSLYFSAGIRQDTALRKVYCYIPPNNYDTLLYDFNLQVGDTLKGYFDIGSPQTVGSIDSIMIENTYRKRFNFINGYCVGNYSFIEGIGCDRGLFDKCDSFEAGGVLICFMQDGKTLYPDTLTNCPQLFIGVNELTNKFSGVNIYPNPTNKTLNIQLEAWSGMQKANLKIVNIIGEELIWEEIKKPDFEMDVSALPNGIYFLKITDGERSYSRKVIVQH